MEGTEKTSGSKSDLDRELDDLRGELLQPFVVGLLTLCWAWYVISAPGSIRMGLLGNTLARPDLAVLTLALGAGLSSRLRARHPAAAAWVFLASSILAQVSMAPYLSVAWTGASKFLIVVMACALLETRQAFAVTTLMWAAQVIDWRLFGGGAGPGSQALGMLAVHYLIFGALYLSNRPLRTSIEWTLGGWNRARAALAEIRERRGELYRVVRALEEASYRIERMNSELLVAWHEAETARAVKARFAATVSHELRGPLNLVLGFSRLMALSPERYGEPLPAAYRADMDTVYSNSRHLIALLDDILDLSQIEAGHLPVVKDRVDLERDVIEEAARSVRPLAVRKGLYLRLEVARNLPPILADKLRLRQVLLNLLTNAIRFAERGGVTVRASRHEEGLLVSVEDTGRGIPAEQLPKLFREFEQLHVRRDGDKGTGLGLSISKLFIQLHGGRMWAESVEGVGTTLHFTVPLPDTEPIAWSDIRTGRGQLHPRVYETCLVVHDDPAMVRVLARYIEGYRVVGLPDASDIVAFVKKLHPRAIITTPGVTGEISEQLRTNSLDVPLLSCHMPHRTKQPHVEGALTYLLKPISPDMVQTAMTQVERQGETTVLLVDDDPDAVRLLETMLTELPRPYNILRAYDGLEALEAMERTVPDVIFIDLLMPGLDGEQTIARMRADPRLCQVPVVIISARDAMGQVAALRAPITVECQRPLMIGQAARCFKALLDLFSPAYLPDPDTSPRPAPAPLG